MNIHDIDTILHCQLTVARLGEKELMNWWNTDMAYEVGGATFLQDLLGETMAPLAAGEGILEAARLKEASLSEGIPQNQGSGTQTLFQPSPKIKTALKERMRHFKRYPDDIPEQIKEILDPRTDFSAEQLIGRIPAETTLQKSGTSFGHQIEKPSSATDADAEFFQNLAAEVAKCEKGNFILHYFHEDDHASV